MKKLNCTFCMALAVAQLAVLLTSLALLLFAMEGVLCIAMALPIASVMALLGGLVGHAFAVRSFLRGANLFLALLALLVWTQRSSLDECADKVREGGLRVDTTCSFFGRDIKISTNRSS